MQWPPFLLGVYRQAGYKALAFLSNGYSSPEGKLPTYYSPVRRFTHRVAPAFSPDLHVLGTPPAFALSQDQTLQLNTYAYSTGHSLKKRVSILFFVSTISSIGFLLRLLARSLLLSFQRPAPAKSRRKGETLSNFRLFVNSH